MKGYYTIEEFAKMKKITCESVYQLIRDGRITIYLCNDELLIPGRFKNFDLRLPAWSPKDCPLCCRTGVIKKMRHSFCPDCWFGNTPTKNWKSGADIYIDFKENQRIIKAWMKDKNAYPWLTGLINTSQAASRKNAYNKDVAIIDEKYGSDNEPIKGVTLDDISDLAITEIIDRTDERELMQDAFLLIGVPMKLISKSPILFDTGMLFQVYDFNSGNPGFEPPNMGILSKDRLKAKTDQSAAIQRAIIQVPYYSKTVSYKELAEYMKVNTGYFSKIAKKGREIISSEIG